MNIYDFNESSILLRSWLKSQPKGGRGVARRLAEQLKLSTVLISQILNGTRSLKLDYAFGLAQVMHLNSDETEYFLLLVQIENASSLSFRNYLKDKKAKLQLHSRQIKPRVSKDLELSEEAKAQFYSHWHYSAVRLATDITDLQDPKRLADMLRISRARVDEILVFLTKHGLCRQEGNLFKMAIRSTHLEKESPWIYNRQMQWRQKGLQKMESDDAHSLFYTGPMVLSFEDSAWIRERLVALIRELTERVRQSPSENLACLNIDWFNLFQS